MSYRAVTGADDFTSGPTGFGGGNTGVSQATNMPTQQQGTTTQQQQSADDAYSQTLLNTLLNQQTQVAAAKGHSSASVLNSNSVAQQIGTGSQSLPSWSDPQIHIRRRRVSHLQHFMTFVTSFPMRLMKIL